MKCRCAVALAKHGSAVSLIARNMKKLNAVADECAKYTFRFCFPGGGGGEFSNQFYTNPRPCDIANQQSAFTEK